MQKVALKDAARAWLPDEIIDRPKASFGAPLRAWVTSDLARARRRRALGGDLVGTGLPAPRRRCSGWSTTSAAGRRDASKQIWQLLTLELWYRNARPRGRRRLTRRTART